jgi:Toxin co-regulated pilus biosynthesis protein Q
VKQIIKFLSITMVLGISLVGCVTRPAPDVPGRWKPANHLPEVPQEIPLFNSYVFYVSPLDGTLKNTLTRWAKDSKMTLSYQHSSDFTLHAQSSTVRSASVQEATAQLSAAYAAQRVVVTVDQNQIVVRQIDAMVPDATTK